MLKALYFVSWLVATSPTAVGEVFVNSEKLFKIEHYETNRGDGIVDISRKTFDNTGRLAYQVKARLEHGLQRTMSANDRQRQLRGEVTFGPKLITYRVVEKNGHVINDTDRVSGPAMSAPGLVHFMQTDTNWSSLLDGEDVKLTYVSWSRQSTYGFRLKQSERTSAEHLVVVMTPSNWFIRRFVPDMYYTFRKSDRRLVRYQGRISVKKVELDGDLTDVIADVRFSYR